MPLLVPITGEVAEAVMRVVKVMTATKETINLLNNIVRNVV